MIEKTKNWIAEYLDTEKNEIETYFKNNDVTGFLIIWTIFEQSLFNGFLKKNQLKPFSRKNKSLLNETLEKHFSHFHDRYQNKKRYSNLRHKDIYKEIDNILSEDKTSVAKEDKLLFLLYVVYRYRNNIFHGSKGVTSWLRYKIQIEKCIETMTILIDYKKK